MAEQASFDPSDPFDAVAQAFKNEVAEMALRMMNVTLFRELPPHKQLEAFIIGSLTGVVGCAFAHVEKSGHDEIVKYIAEVLPFCRAQADACTDEPLSRSESPK